MKKAIAFSLALALMLGLAFAPLHVSRAEADNPLTDAFNALSEQDNLHMDMDMALDINVAIAAEGQTIMTMPMSIALTVGMDEQIKPACSYIQMSMNMNAMGQAQDMSVILYTEQSEAGTATYTSNDGGASWKVSRTEAGGSASFDPAAMVALVVNNIKDLATVGTEVVDGVEATVYSGKLDTSFIQEALASAGAADALAEMSEDTGLSEDFFSTLGDIPFTMSIDPSTHLPLKMTMDLTDMLNNMLGSLLKQFMGMGDMEGYEVNVDIGTTVVECRMKDYNAVGPVSVPDSVKAVAVEEVEEDAAA